MCPEFSYSKGRIPATVKDNKGLRQPPLAESRVRSQESGVIMDTKMNKIRSYKGGQ